MNRIAAGLLLAAFAVFNIYVLRTVGYWAVVRDPFKLLSTTQVFVDLTIALSLVNLWILLDCRRRGRTWLFVPFLLMTIMLGSMGPLLYLALRKDPPGT